MEKVIYPEAFAPQPVARTVDQIEQEMSALNLIVPSTRDNECTADLLTFVVDAVLECEKDLAFSGFQIQEARNKEGKLLSMRLVATDNVGGIIAPRTV